MPEPRIPFTIRRYLDDDREAVVDLFVRVNQNLAPPDMKEAFAAYVARSIAEEVGQIGQYYDAGRGRSFWVATDGSRLLGTFGLEPVDGGAIEVRRMYVDLPFRRVGIARAMLNHAETCARQEGFDKIILSTSSLQQPALALYRSAGYRLVRQERAQSPSLRTVGNGILRFYLEKPMSQPDSSKNGQMRSGFPPACSYQHGYHAIGLATFRGRSWISTTSATFWPCARR
jgi:GNAT superfamily N-acetyltransferase